MPDLISILNESITTILWPAFKALGYRKSGNNFRFYDQTGWGKIVQFQKSQGNSATELSFTVNTGLYLPEADYSFPDGPGPKFTEPDCIVRKRLGRLKKSKVDEWYDITPDTNVSQLFSALADDFTHYLHPYLAAVTGRESILDMLLAGGHSSTRIQVISTLYLVGRKDAAVQLLTSELAQSSNLAYRSVLKNLALDLGIPQPL
jgi:hypothetical protein